MPGLFLCSQRRHRGAYVGSNDKYITAPGRFHTRAKIRLAQRILVPHARTGPTTFGQKEIITTTTTKHGVGSCARRTPSLSFLSLVHVCLSLWRLRESATPTLCWKHASVVVSQVSHTKFDCFSSNRVGTKLTWPLQPPRGRTPESFLLAAEQVPLHPTFHGQNPSPREVSQIRPLSVSCSHAPDIPLHPPNNRQKIRAPLDVIHPSLFFFFSRLCRIIPWVNPTTVGGLRTHTRPRAWARLLSLLSLHCNVISRLIQASIQFLHSIRIGRKSEHKKSARARLNNSVCITIHFISFIHSLSLCFSLYLYSRCSRYFPSNNKRGRCVVGIVAAGDHAS